MGKLHAYYVRLNNASYAREGTMPTAGLLMTTTCSCRIGESHPATEAQQRRYDRVFTREAERQLKAWRNTRCDGCGNLNRNCKCEDDYCDCCC